MKYIIKLFTFLLTPYLLLLLASMIIKDPLSAEQSIPTWIWLPLICLFLVAGTILIYIFRGKAKSRQFVAGLFLVYLALNIFIMDRLRSCGGPFGEWCYGGTARCSWYCPAIKLPAGEPE